MLIFAKYKRFVPYREQNTSLSPKNHLFAPDQDQLTVFGSSLSRLAMKSRRPSAMPSSIFGGS